MVSQPPQLTLRLAGQERFFPPEVNPIEVVDVDGVTVLFAVGADGSVIAPSMSLDHLDLASYVAVGALPAHSGAVRLSQGGAVSSRNANDTGDNVQLEATSFVDGGTTYDLYELFNGDLAFDPDDNTVMALFGGVTVVLSDSTAPYDPATVQTGRRSQLAAGTLAVVGDAAGTAEIHASTDAGEVQAVSANGTARFDATASNALGLLVTLEGVPVATPAINLLWLVDAAGLAAALAGGAKYAMVQTT